MTIAWSIETHDNLQSTQDVIKALAEAGGLEGKVVQALEQSHGRGRHGREWVSEKGNLYLSLLLRPQCQARYVGQLSIVIAVALGETIRSFIEQPENLNLKWPNDVQIGAQKCAGILIETALGAGGSLAYAVVGVGVNVASAPPRLGAALDDHAKKAVSLKKFRDEFLANIGKYYALWQGGGFVEIRLKWLEMAHKRGAVLRVKMGTDIQQGAFDTIDDEGNLLLLDRDLRQKKVTAGEVYLI